MRTYGDFAQRSPIPARADGKTTAPRNSPPLVNASLPRSVGTLFHFDGEFSTMVGLTAASFTSRNFGWLPGERAQAIAHVARIVREGNGTDALAQESVLITPASEWECASHFAGGALKDSRGLRPHFPGQVTERTQDRHRLGQRTFHPEPVVVLQTWAFILMKEANHDEDIAKTRTTSFSVRPRDLSQR